MGTPERPDHISTKSVLFKVGLKVPTPKHEVVAAEGTAKGGRIGDVQSSKRLAGYAYLKMCTLTI